MAKVKREKDAGDFGMAGGEVMISPFSYQLNGQGTPEHPLDTIPEGDGKPKPRGYPLNPTDIPGCEGYKG